MNEHKHISSFPSWGLAPDRLVKDSSDAIKDTPTQ